MSSGGASRSMVMVVVVGLVLVAAAMGGAIYVVVSDPRKPASIPDPSQSPAEPRNEASNLGVCDVGVEGSCPQGQLCVEGECVARTTIGKKFCMEEMVPCDSCRCESPMECVAGLCRTKPEDEKVCDNPEVQKLLRKLNECQGSRHGKDAGACSADDWEEFAIKGDDFDRLMASFSTKIAVHFWTGAPEVRYGQFDQKARDYYLGKIRQYKSKFDAAGAIFLIGRASRSGYKGGGPNNDIEKKWNKQLGLRRMDFASQLMTELYAASNASPDQIVELGRKVIQFGLGDQKPVEVDFFYKNYLKNYIMWEPQAEEKMKQFLDDPSKNEQWARNTINQVAMIIPVPCHLTPAKPPAPASAN